MREIVFAGSGGQGVLTVGLIISDIAATEGLNVTWVPSYGSAMRGGTANCTVKYCAENYIYNPSQEQPDLLLAMNEPSLHMFLPIVAPGGTVLVGDTVTIPDDARQDVTYVHVNCTDLPGQPQGCQRGHDRRCCQAHGRLHKGGRHRRHEPHVREEGQV